jgi:ABC-type branched-subunit amino acid transport system substrate-binding protein
MLAVQDVNSDLSLLDGKTLQYVYADSGCGSLESMDALKSLESMDALKSLESMDANTSLTDRPLDAVMGPACSLGCESSAYSLRKSKIPQVSFGCSDPSLTGKKNPTVRVCIASCSPHLHLMGLS